MAFFFYFFFIVLIFSLSFLHLFSRFNSSAGSSSTTVHLRSISTAVFIRFEPSQPWLRPLFKVFGFGFFKTRSITRPPCSWASLPPPATSPSGQHVDSPTPHMTPSFLPSKQVAHHQFYCIRQATKFYCIRQATKAQHWVLKAFLYSQSVLVSKEFSVEIS